MKSKLALALLRRKELQNKLDSFGTLTKDQLFYEHVQRVSVAEGLDEIRANFPKLELRQVTAERDHYAKQLRLVDAAIQQANWNTEIDLEDSVMQDWQPPAEDKK